MSKLVNITNTPVSEQLDGSNDPLNVPSGEVWRVNVSIGTRERDGSKMVCLRLNGTPFMSIGCVDDGDYQSNGTTTCDMVLVGGDTLDWSFGSADNNDGGAHIGGWKVKE